MNIYKSLNEITEYIDKHLESKIDYKKLAKIIGTNTYTLQRIFSLLTNITLTEYIRKRRLSNAGFDLINSNLKIIDIALKYQYDNATSFSRAFSNFHGIKPSKVKKNVSKLKNFPRLIFNEEIKVSESMEYKIEEKNEMILYGVGIKVTNKTIGKEAPKLFKEIRKKYQNVFGDINFGMVTYKNNEREECDKYYCLYDKEIDEFEKIIIPKSKWIILRINSNEAKDIQELSNKFYYDFLPSCKYNLREIPELEYYYDDVTEFWVPIY